MHAISRTMAAVLALILLLPDTAAAEAAKLGEEAKKAPTAPAGPPDAFGRGVPRSSVKGFLEAAEAKDWERAAEYLDLRNLPRDLEPREGPELARQLASVLSRTLWIDLEALSDEPRGYDDDGLPSYRDFVGRIEMPHEQVDVLLQRVPRGDGAFIWKFSNATVAEVPPLYAHHGFGTLGEALAELLPSTRLLGIPVWEWVGLLLLMSASLLLAWLAWALVGLLLRLAPLAGIAPTVLRFRGPAVLLFFCAVGRAAVGFLGPTAELRVVLEARTLLIVAVGWLVMRTGDLMVERASARLQQRGQPAAHLLGRPARNLLRGLVVLVAGVFWLDNLGVSVTTLIAGLGIGGLAVALAAQRSIEDLIGAITIHATQTARVGDFCRFGEKLGTVEEIGLRSTRIRTLDDSILTVPTGEFSKLQVDNLGERRKMWYHPRLRLRFDTTPEQVQRILTEIHDVLSGHPRVQPDPARIRFAGFGDWSLDLDVFAYVDTRDYAEFLEVAEELNLRAMRTVAAAGAHFAVPPSRAA